MENCRQRGLLALLLLASFTMGCGLNTSVMQRGGNGRMGVLLNYSCGAYPCDAIDPAKPTIVMTHGWNPLPNLVHATFAEEGSKALRCRCGDSYNLLSWDWNAVRVSPFQGDPFRVGRCQGKMLAAALRSRGVNPCRTQIIGHSLGTVVATQAAVCLRDRGPMAQLTLLDPPTSLHAELFCRLRAQDHACVVENYWSPGISGYGDEVPYRGVQNYNIGRGHAPVRGIVDLSVSNHLHTMLWYYETMCNPAMRCGFQNSVFVRCCGRKGCLCKRCSRESSIVGPSSSTEVALQTTQAEGSASETSAGSRKR